MEQTVAFPIFQRKGSFLFEASSYNGANVD
jgi:hypothetical protein